MSYRVDLDIFRGPLDLLLYLVRKDELDIFDIPLARLTEQYLEYLSVLELIDVDVAGDFLVMASTLMELKSRMLLPQIGGDGEPEADPRLELVRQLLEYKRFRDAAEQLGELAADQRQRYARLAVESLEAGQDPASEPIRDVELWDLVSAFGRLMRQTLAMAPRSIVYDDTPIEVYIGEILERLTRDGQIAFSRLFEGPPDRGRIIGKFLAVLELARAKKIRAEQNEPFGEIWILPGPEPEPAGDVPNTSAAGAEATLGPQ